MEDVLENAKLEIDKRRKIMATNQENKLISLEERKSLKMDEIKRNKVIELDQHTQETDKIKKSFEAEFLTRTIDLQIKNDALIQEHADKIAALRKAAEEKKEQAKEEHKIIQEEKKRLWTEQQNIEYETNLLEINRLAGFAEEKKDGGTKRKRVGEKTDGGGENNV